MVVGQLEGTLQAPDSCELTCDLKRSHHLFSLDGALEHPEQLLVHLVLRVLDLALQRCRGPLHPL